MNKGLEALSEMVIHLNNNYARTRQALEDFRNIEKELKALEIIEAKEVDLFSIKYTASLEMYNYRMKNSGFAYAHRLLTQEEYDSLKRYCYEL